AGAVFHRADEQFARANRLDHRLTVLGRKQIIAQGYAESLKDRARQQEAVQLRRQVVQHHAGKIIDQFGQVATEHLRVRLPTLRPGQHAKLDTGGPAFRHFPQTVAGIFIQVRTQTGAEHFAIPLGKTQIMTVNHQQAIIELEAAERKLRMRTTGKNQVNVFRQLRQQLRQYIVNQAAFGQLEIIDQDMQRLLDDRQG